jgi:hypothetical protein
MRSLRLVALALLFVSNIAAAGVPACPPLTWCEGGIDAGDKFSPQDIVGGPYFSILGSIGGADTADAFRFAYPGGPVAIFNTLLDTIPAPLPMQLYDNSLVPVLIPPTSAAPGSKFYLSLLPGTYILELTLVGADPPFHVSFSGPPISGVAAIPEPSTWALMLAGLAGILVMTRRRIGH